MHFQGREVFPWPFICLRTKGKLQVTALSQYPLKVADNCNISGFFYVYWGDHSGNGRPESALIETLYKLFHQCLVEVSDPDNSFIRI